MKPVAPVSATCIWSSERSCSSDCLNLSRASKAVKQALELFRPACGSAGAAAEGPSEWRDQQALDLLLGLVPELCPDGREGQPVQHSGREPRAEDQLSVLDVGNVCLQHPKNVGTNL